jgi:hypothetical protein
VGVVVVVVVDTSDSCQRAMVAVAQTSDSCQDSVETVVQTSNSCPFPWLVAGNWVSWIGLQCVMLKCSTTGFSLIDSVMDLHQDAVEVVYPWLYGSFSVRLWLGHSNLPVHSHNPTKGIDLEGR